VAINAYSGTGNVTTAASTTQPVVANKPANLADGNTLLEFIGNKNSSGTYTATGFTSLASYIGANPIRTTQAFFKNIATASSEPATYSTTSTSATSRYGKLLCRADGVATSALDAPGAGVVATTGTSVVVPGVTAVAANALLVLVAQRNHGGLTATALLPPTGQTEWGHVDSVDGASLTTLFVSVEQLTSSGPTGTRTMLFPSGDNINAYMFTLAPAVTAGPSAVFTTAATLLAVSVDATTSTGTSLTYAWNFGDGTTSTTGPTTSHTYAAAGTYAITLQVTDGASLTSTTSHTITVAPAPTGSTDTAVAVTGPDGARMTVNAVDSFGTVVTADLLVD
jgi:PKD repeat protein